MSRTGAKEGRNGVLSRTLRRFTDSAPTTDDRETRDETARSGCAPIAEQPDRRLVTMHGTVRSVTLRPRGGAPSLEADLFDGSGSVLLVWLGRRRVEGITPGRRLTVHGRLGRRDRARILFNPRYELTA